MKPSGRIPIGLVALTLASIVLSVAVFWSFRGHGSGREEMDNGSPPISGPAAGQLSSEDGWGRAFESREDPAGAFSPETVATIVLSLMATFLLVRPLKSAPAKPYGRPAAAEQLRPDDKTPAPDDSAKTELHPSGQTGAEAAGQCQVGRLLKQCAGANGQLEAVRKPEPDQIEAIDILSHWPEPAIKPGPAPPEAKRPGLDKKWLSTTGPALGLALDSRLIPFGQSSRRAATSCPLGPSMRGLIRAVKQISHSGRQIDQLVKIVDDLVFQSNLLALEAAVEAGRVGRSGRGLVTVASKSRQLAICSAQAAQNTANLVASVQAQLQTGSEMVQTVVEYFISSDQPAEGTITPDSNQPPAG